MLITAGERKATALLCLALHDMGSTPSRSPAARPASSPTPPTPTPRSSRCGPIASARRVDAGRVPVVGGSQGVSTDRNVTFLGRGGTDTTAVALAHALGADICELYTDVSGVFTSDPRVVPDARKMERISFDELLEMTANGCPKPAMRSVEYARTHGVDLHVRSSFTWEPGTLVTKEEQRHGTGHHLGGRARHRRGQGHRGRRARPARRGRAAVPGAGRSRDQRRPDRAEHLRAGQDRHLLHRAPRRRRGVAGGVRGPGRRDRRHRRSPPTSRSPGSAWSGRA